MSEERPTEASRGERPSMPLWVKVFGAVAVAVLALFVILLVVGGGHGPTRHGAGPLPSHVGL